VVSVGDRVEPETVIGFAGSRQVHRLRVHLDPDHFRSALLKREGDEVKQGEVLVEESHLFGLGVREYCSPADGVVERVDYEHGFLFIRERGVAVRALLPGRVVETVEMTAVVIEADGHSLRVAGGVGAARRGPVLLLGEGDDRLPPDTLEPAHAGQIVAWPGWVDREGLWAALRMGVAGLVVGGAPEGDLAQLRARVETLTPEEYLVAHCHPDLSAPERRPYQGEEWLGPTVMVTDGFGRVPMGRRVREVLGNLAGRAIYLSGGPAEPYAELILPPDVQLPAELPAEVRPGSLVGAFSPLQGLRVGRVLQVEFRPVLLETGQRVPAALVRFGDGEERWVPLANLRPVE